MGLPTIVLIALTAASIAYQVQLARKAKRRAAEAADAAKGREIAVEGESISLPVCYGRNLIAGARVFHATRSNFDYAPPATGGVAFNYNLASSRTGEKNEYLYVQQAICYGPINNIIDIRIDDQDPSETPELQYGQVIHAYKNGGVADPLFANTEIGRSEALFTDCAHAAMVFRLNRDDPQYGGPPDVAFYIEGKLVRTIIKSGTNYSLGSYTYSNNPSLCLLDYLLDSKYGRGLSVNDIDLESFYYGFEVCNKIVQYNVPVKGNIWSKRDPAITQRNLPLYECNIVIDTEKPIRDNIIELLSTMGDSDLVWSGGKYKLQIQYPSDLGQIKLAGTLTENDVVRSTIEISYPTANDRMNYCTIKFRDEALDFKENTASWPPKGSSIYTQLLQQDNNIPLENSFNEAGVSDYYHALAKAEELVRVSRSSVNYSFKLNLNSNFYEPGDIVYMPNILSFINNEYLKIVEVKVNEDGTSDIVAVKFDPDQLAWNVKDDQLIPVRNTYDFVLQPPAPGSIFFIPSSPLSVSNGIGLLIWNPPENITPASYIIEYRLSGETDFKSLGVSSTNQFEIFSLKSGTYQFAIRSRSTLGVISKRAISSNININDGTLNPPNILVEDNIVLSKGKVVTNLYVKIISPPIAGFLLGYEVDVRKEGDTEWINLGISSNNLFEYSNVVDSENYEVRARIVNKVGGYSEYTSTTHNIVGKQLPPSNISNFFFTLNKDGITLNWTISPDVDLDYYEIRKGESWTNSTLVVRTKDNFYNIPKPAAITETYYIKGVDTTGNYSLTESFIEIGVNSPQLQTGTGIFSGENYVLQWNPAPNILPIEEYIIESNSQLIARIKSTTYLSKANWLGSKVFSIKAVDIAGNIGEPLLIELVTIAAPATSITSEVIDNNILLTWNPVSGTLPTVGYEIKRGNDYSTAVIRGFISAEFATLFESYAGDYTYWVTAKDSAGNYGTPAAITSRISQPPDYVLAVDYYTDFSTGTKVNAVGNAGSGLLIPVNPNRTWEQQFTTQGWTNFQDAINSPYSLFIQPGNLSGYYEEVFDYGALLQFMNVSLIPTISIAAGNPSYQIDLAISADGITYTNYPNTTEVFASNFRYIKFRITVTGDTNDDILSIDKLNLILSAKLKNDNGTASVLASDTTGTIVNFNETFLDIVSITVTPRGTAPAVAIYDFLDEPNPTSFKIYLFNPQTGARVNGTVSWSAKGY